MREAREDEEGGEDRGGREEVGGGPGDLRPVSVGGGHPPPPFNILSPHMLNMMDRMRSGEGRGGGGGGGREEATSPMNLSSEKEEKPRTSDGR